jgi:hypothetical protein
VIIHRHTRASSLPIPLLPPVIRTVFPVWSGTSLEVQRGLGGKSWLKMLMRDSDIVTNKIKIHENPNLTSRGLPHPMSQSRKTTRRDHSRFCRSVKSKNSCSVCIITSAYGAGGIRPGRIVPLITHHTLRVRGPCRVCRATQIQATWHLLVPPASRPHAVQCP